MKKFLLKTILFSLPFILALLYFHFFFLTKPRSTRGLSAIGNFYMPLSYEFCTDTLQDDLVTTITDFENCENNDSIILTIGDSFSQQGIRGYNNYLAHFLPNYKVLNIKRNDNDPEELFVHYVLTNRIPKIVIVESVERYCIGRLNSLKFKKLDSIRPFKSAGQKTYLQKAQNYYRCLLGIDRSVGRAKLKKALFSCEMYQRDLFFLNLKHDSDIIQFNHNEILSAREKLDSLFKFAENHGITLYYLVAADKYDVYQDEILDNKYPPRSLMDSLSAPFADNKYFVNTKSIIRPYVEAGELDMYYCDDSHWSTKSARVVAQELAQRIKGE